MSQFFSPLAFQEGWYWISGGTSGIGFGVAKLLARYNARIIISSRNEENLAAAKIQLLELGAPEVVTVSLDFLPPVGLREGIENTASYDHFAHIKNLAAKTCANRPLAGVLLNGGGPHGTTFENITGAQIDEAHWLLFKGPAALFQGLLPFLQQNETRMPKHGTVSLPASVVAITSTTVKETNPALPLSGAYRSALVSLLKTASFTAGAQCGIRINNVAPGYTATEKLAELKTYVSEREVKSIADIEKQWASQAALGRIGEVEEIANAVLYLFSPAASFLTGHTLVVDGGQMKSY